MTPELEKRIKELIQDEILIVPYNPEWPELFAREAGFLRAKLPLSILRRIEHFGSTAVPGLAAKPIIDLLVEVTSLTQTKQEIVPILQSLVTSTFSDSTANRHTRGSSNETRKASARITFTW